MSELGRIAGPGVNADLRALVTIRVEDEAWQATANAGVEAKVLERIPSGLDARETVILRLAPGAELARARSECRVDVFVLAGSVLIGGQGYGERHYLRIPAGEALAVSAPEGATILAKQRAATGDAPFAIDTADRANWAAWGGRGSEKAQLYDRGALPEASWVGFMLPDLTIPEHDHAGGEEIFILEGELRDERGLYGPGTWVRFPVGVTHTPTSLAAGCMMLVREGDAFPAV